MMHWLELLSTHAPLALCRVLVWVAARAFACTLGDGCLLLCLRHREAAAAAFPALTLSVTPFHTHHRREGS